MLRGSLMTHWKYFGNCCGKIGPLLVLAVIVKSLCFTILAMHCAGATPVRWKNSRFLNIRLRDSPVSRRSPLVEFFYTKIIPSENDQPVTHEAAILIACLIFFIHINYGKVVAIQVRRKARQNNLSIPFQAMVSQLCTATNIPYSSSDDEGC